MQGTPPIWAGSTVIRSNTMPDDRTLSEVSKLSADLANRTPARAGPISLERPANWSPTDQTERLRLPVWPSEASAQRL